MENNVDTACESAAGLNLSMETIQEYQDYPRFIRIREEMNKFLLNLNQSNVSDCAGQQIHYLFIALLHLDNIDKEIKTSEVNEEIIRLEMIHEKIRSLKSMILTYIKKLSAESLTRLLGLIQGERKHRAPAMFAADMYGLFVCFDYMFNNGKAQSGSTHSP